MEFIYTNIYTIVILLNVASFTLSVFLSEIGYKLQKNKIALYFFLLMCIYSLWNFFKLISLFILSIDAQIIIFDFTRGITIFTPLLNLYIIISYLNPKSKLLNIPTKILTLIAILLAFLTFTEPLHNLLNKNFDLIFKYNIPILIFQPKSISVIFLVYLYFCLLFTILYLLYYLVISSIYFKKQILFILAAIAIPIINDILFRFDISLISGYHLTPEFFAIGNLFFAFALFGQKFLKIIPLTRDKIVDSIEDIIISVNQEHIIIDINQSCENRFLISYEQANGNQFFHTFQVYPELIDYYNTLDKDEIKIQFPNEFAFFSIRYSQIIYNSNERITIFILRDITKMKITEIQLLEYSKELEKLNSTKDRFFSIIAHDLKNPFIGLMSISEGMLISIDNISKNDLIQNLQLINHSSKNGYRLLENLLDWSRIQTNSIKLNIQSVSIQRIINDTVNITKITAINKNIEIVQNNIEEINVLVDYNSILTVFRNILTNAIKFSHKNSKIYITSDSTKHEDKLEIIISDQGIGIPISVQNKLFQIDQKVSNKGTEDETGTGLGLILCKEFIEMNCGEIWIESVVHQGTSIYITLQKA